MITLIHGDDVVASRAEFNRLKVTAKGKEIRVLDGRGVDAASLTQAVESASLFSARGGPASGWGGETVVFIENLFGKLGRKTKLIEALAAILTKSAENADIVLWEDKELSSTVIKNLGRADVKLFKTPAIIFQFLDTLAPNNATRLIPLYQQLVEQEAPELIFAMLGRRLRHLIQLRDGTIPEGLQGWQASRLTRQAKLFTMEKLLSMYKKLLDMEYSIKSGSSPFTLRQLTEQFIVDV